MPLRVEQTVNPAAIRAAGTVDNMPPLVSALAVGSITATGATITWTTDEPATSRVDYGRTDIWTEDNHVDGATLVTSHTAVITGLTSAKGYRVLVKNIDAAGNAFTVPMFTFTTS